MPIIRNSAQKSQTLAGFYSEQTEPGVQEHTARMGAGMLSFIEMVNETFLKTQLYGLTSHYRLVIQSEDDYKSDWFVTVICDNSNNYHFSYLMPEAIGPWKAARVNGIAHGVEEARKYLIIAMMECRGWAENEELQRLYQSIQS